ncbi:hypothetical protein A2291_01525 [candidate division WOR-1 bacterium RIFOXYB2_FULL_42_35]|uniref:Uncharacterized protein n=1 Tax=candidate division WOR-1 bacterium RIFOXYC2_FULL_41_25 TaxID=1802586 RepID=A0A1F4TQ36_UNCSA|nr:MAG: hypothetical protein A2247_03325 [candidate division WOR-1 bacterium RIFOXYA2_FULL_41_14]OGC25426.1 MAG: hypothetical protein A2291_01525 [candidate division WOR-1 bacterium RIFOXYB2_FULL_42_35]OGC34832.1 MAG: hypothetical protein A2462_05460 [candidate division WOR-1 bacterium RIFOXYC2_FULL_41_25]
MDSSFANIKFNTIWDVVVIALVFASTQILVVVAKRIIEHKFSHEPTREDKIANDLFDRVKGLISGHPDGKNVKARVAEFNLIREMLKKPSKEIIKEL